LCGRFEGVDERVITEYNATEISIGDYILSGGEIAAFTLLDSVVRLLPGAVRNQDTLLEESLELEGEYQGMLEPPLYTRPEEWLGHKVPAILLSGDHEKIKQWKLQQSRLVTKSRRPDLIK
jgi:tRNA (guanine37-N1)-methyltransferase